MQYMGVVIILMIWDTLQINRKKIPADLQINILTVTRVPKYRKPSIIKYE